MDPTGATEHAEHVQTEKHARTVNAYPTQHVMVKIVGMMVKVGYAEHVLQVKLASKENVFACPTVLPPLPPSVDKTTVVVENALALVEIV